MESAEPGQVHRAWLELCAAAAVGGESGSLARGRRAAVRAVRAGAADPQRDGAAQKIPREPYRIPPGLRARMERRGEARGASGDEADAGAIRRAGVAAPLHVRPG